MGFFLGGQTIKETFDSRYKSNPFIDPLVSTYLKSVIIPLVIPARVGTDVHTLDIDFYDDLFGYLFLGNNLSGSSV